jgi:integral membrane sensor domain MASE1
MSDLANALPRAIGELGGAIQGFVGLTRQSRLRGQIRDSLTLYSAAKTYGDLEVAQADLARVITLQTAELLAAVDPSRARKRDWSGAIVGFVFTALIGGLAWAMWGPWDLRRFWWGWILILLTTAIGILFLGVALSLLKKQPPKEGIESSAPVTSPP